GIDKSGSSVLYNDEGVLIQGEGVLIQGGASKNTIGGSAEGMRNIISGNKDDGVQINGIGTVDNIVQGNYIGTDVLGTMPLGNQRGVEINNAGSNTIGGDFTSAGNVISGNEVVGVVIHGEDADVGDTTVVVVEGNRIGPNANDTGTFVTYGEGEAHPRL